MIRVFFAGAMLCCALCGTGCETARGTAQGLGYEAQGTQSLVEGTIAGAGAVGEGVGRDATNFWGHLKRADEWLQKNLW